MTADRWRQIEDIFNQAVEQPLGARAQFLHYACGSDAELRREVESLLACDAPDEELINVLGDAEATLSAEMDPGLAGRRIGSYRLTRWLGNGGMGSVYLGVRDDDQYQKQVAIKLLKRGMDTSFMLSRFRQERQILANLDHPFIARLIDGGATEEGLPYFVMEYVDGTPITQYCAAKDLSIPERLNLFRMVCEAVQHAHQNLVVHRDIKPGNILVTREGTPKLLDFGIAKVLDPGSAAGVTLTPSELRMLTPGYASPEQMKGLPVSTASDTYSLGAVLYELLAGRNPHRFTSNSIADMETAICVTEPLKPSLAAGDNDGLPPAARKRLRRQLSGDLDNIVLTALRKEPQRRYASAAEFAEDLRRHTEGLPVLAHEDRWTYRALKFVRRHRWAVAAAASIVAILVGGIVSTTIQARRAEERFQIVRGLARTTLYDLYGEMERLPGSISLRVATIRTVAGYLDDLARNGAHEPDLDLEIAAAYERVGNLEGHPFTSNLGRGPDALRSYRKALEIFERLSATTGYRDQALRGLIDTNLKISALEALRGNPAASSLHSEKAYALASDGSAAGSSGIPFSTRINVYFRLADLEYDRGLAQPELEKYRKALELARSWVAAEGSEQAYSRLIESYRNAGSALARTGDLTAALESYRTAERLAAELSRRSNLRQDQYYDTVNIQTAIGDILAAPDDPNFGDRNGALARYQQALALAERLAALDTRNVNAGRLAAGCNWRLGMISAREQPRQALEYCRKALRIAQEAGALDPQNLEYRYHASRAYLWMGDALHTLGRHSEAIESLTQALALQHAIVAVSPQRIWNLRVLSRTYSFLAAAQLDRGLSAEALQSLQQGLTVADRILQRAPASLPHQLDRADVLEATGRYYATLAAIPGTDALRRTELLRLARSNYEQGLAVWQSWINRKLAAPYAARRANQASLALAALGPAQPEHQKE